MINCFIGYPGDGKTTCLLNYSRIDNVEKDSKLIIYDDSFLIGQSEQIIEHCSLTDIDYIQQEKIDIDFLNAKSKEGKNIYIDWHFYFTSSDYFNKIRDEIRYLSPLKKVFVIDAIRLLYLSNTIKFELQNYDTIIITKLDFLVSICELKTIIDQILISHELYIIKMKNSVKLLKRVNKGDMDLLYNNKLNLYR